MPAVQCPLCSKTLTETHSVLQDMDASVYKCPQCGQFIYSDYTGLLPDFENSKQLISAWVRRQNKLGNNYPIVAKDDTTGIWFQKLRSMGFPQTVNEKLDELLKAYAHRVKDDYGKIIKAIHYPMLISEIAGKDYAEIKGLNQLLVELGYLWTESSHQNEHIRITAKGWQRINDLNQPSYSSELAFIAMWYDPSLANYRESVKKAITECGYQPIIIDDVDFNDFIMDEVIQFIRQARFLVADLTCLPEIDS